MLLPQDILTETGCAVELPPSDVLSETVTLLGESEKLGTALTYVYAKVSLNFVLTTEVSF